MPVVEIATFPASDALIADHDLALGSLEILKKAEGFLGYYTLLLSALLVLTVVTNAVLGLVMTLPTRRLPTSLLVSSESISISSMRPN